MWQMRVVKGAFLSFFNLGHFSLLFAAFWSEHISYALFPTSLRGVLVFDSVSRRGTLRGRRGAWRHPPALCVAGAALITLGWLWWRAWAPLVAGTLHGRRGTWRHPPALMSFHGISGHAHLQVQTYSFALRPGAFL